MKQTYQYYKKSGNVLAKTLEYAEKLTKPGEKLINIAEELEKFIRKHSVKPAFPVNISINEIAAHYSPIIQDETVIPDESVVKVDAGVSVNGYLTDAARTFIFDSKWKEMQEVAEIAFEKALSVIEPNGSVFKVGEIVEKTLNEKGYKPIRNLSGHLMTQYSLHGGVSIPNYNVPKNARDKSHKFIPGNAYAVEPFVTTGAGQVFDDDNMTIYRHYRNLEEHKISDDSKAIYNYIEKNFNGLPFSWRWVYNAGFSSLKIKKVRNTLLQKQVIHGYPVLIESKYAPVTQVEDTLYVEKENIFVLTRK